MQKALFTVALLNPQWKMMPARKIARGEKLPKPNSSATDLSLLCLANPHALHAKGLKQAAEMGFRAILCEKPVCVSLEEVSQLRQFPPQIEVGVCHGYRVMWGPKELRRLIVSAEMGKIISIEGRYWQSSAAQKALLAQPPSLNWKNDTALSGKYDVVTDLGSHWTDLMFFLAGEKCQTASGWKSYINSEVSHRDTHVHLTLDFATVGKTFGSISKTVHGRGNHLEVNVIGEKLCASWSFEDPDTLRIGRGDQTHWRSRPREAKVGSGQSPFHGMGWLEGYVEIAHQLLRKATGESSTDFPSLGQALDVIETLLRISM